VADLARLGHGEELEAVERVVLIFEIGRNVPASSVTRFCVSRASALG